MKGNHVNGDCSESLDNNCRVKALRGGKVV